jgi:hypothetical protein
MLGTTSIPRIHHPSGAAPLGTPVRGGFSNAIRETASVPNHV